MSDRSETADWAIILAGGEGKRLAPLTRALYGHDLPKQFAVLAGDRSLLQQTVERIAPLIPFERMVVVVTERYEALTRSQIEGYPGVHLVVQTKNLDTGPGVIAGLAHVRARAPNGRVVVFPADHYVADASRFLSAVRSARTAASGDVALVGARPDGPESEYGWIVATGNRPARVPGARRVVEFVEKPPASVAARLFARGALWNTFVFAGRVPTLWSVSSRFLPEHAASLMDTAGMDDGPRKRRALRTTYAHLSPANFSSAVLERCPHMVVVEAFDTGWSDWGTPERVFASLTGAKEHGALAARVRSRRGPQSRDSGSHDPLLVAERSG